ncbi:hypothetical protein A2U01_0085198, partial [Trifolium medium]|nr:hypothetical protein [Trifolium medium]
CSIGGGKAREAVIGTWRSSVGPLGAVGRQRNDGGEGILSN